MKKRLGRDRAGNKLWILGHEGIKKKLFKNCEIVKNISFFSEWETEDFMLHLLIRGLRHYVNNTLPLEVNKSYEETALILKGEGCEW